MSDEVVKMNARDKPMDIEETEIDVGTGPGDDADPHSPNSQPVRTESGPLLYSGQFPGGQSVLPVAAVAPMHQQMDDMTAESEDNNEPIAIDIPNNDEDSQMDNPISTDENETTCGERTTTFWESNEMSRDFRGNATGVDSTSDFEDRPHPTQKKKFKCLQFEDEEDDPDDPFKSEGTIYLEIDCFSQFAVGSAEAQQRLSKPIYVRGLPWKILAIPRETRETTKSGQAQKCLGFFLQCNGDSDLVSWNCMATATLKVLGKDGEDHKRKIAHTFYPKENDWGYSQFLTCEQLKNELYCQDDTIRLMVQVSADAPHGVQWDSKAHTGFIGLKNQGATCYMNSILQTFFFTNKLRKAVYEMPVSDEPVEANVGLAMQRVFYDLQYSDKPVGTKKLTKSFGWDSIETFMQHDVQELCRVLLDNLENKMKGTPVAETIPWLFKGKMKSFIKCTDVDFESSRVEDFYDIQLNIRSKHDGYGRHQEISSNPGFNLMDSFREYTEVERLDGDNKYDAGEYGMQPAEKGVKFVSFPPVLHLQLMRFQYDPQLDQNVKINDRFVFPDRLNLAEFVENADGPQEDYQYILQAVLVHTGDFHGGHYVVFINTNAKAPLEGAKSRWCKFDDDVVSRAKAKDAIIANYGGDDSETPNKTYTSAYMLVYVRESTISDVLCDVADNDIPDYLKQRFEAEKTEETRKKKEKSEAHLYTELSILTEDVILGHHGFDLFDTATLEEVEKREKIEKKISFRHLYEVLADRVYSSEYQKVHPSEFRLWKFEENNFKDEHTAMSLSRLRPATLLPYTGEDSEKSLETTLDSEKTILFLEEVNLRTRLLPEYNDNSILMFFKYYDDLTQTLSVVGHLIINYKKPLNAVQDLCCDMARIARGTKLKFYEEWNHEQGLHCRQIHPLSTFKNLLYVENDEDCNQNQQSMNAHDYLLHLKAEERENSLLNRIARDGQRRSAVYNEQDEEYEEYSDELLSGLSGVTEIEDEEGSTSSSDVDVMAEEADELFYVDPTVTLVHDADSGEESEYLLTDDTGETRCFRVIPHSKPSGYQQIQTLCYEEGGNTQSAFRPYQREPQQNLPTRLNIADPHDLRVLIAKQALAPLMHQQKPEPINLQIASSDLGIPAEPFKIDPSGKPPEAFGHEEIDERAAVAKGRDYLTQEVIESVIKCPLESSISPRSQLVHPLSQQLQLSPDFDEEDKNLSPVKSYPRTVDAKSARHEKALEMSTPKPLNKWPSEKEDLNKSIVLQREECELKKEPASQFQMNEPKKFKMGNEPLFERTLSLRNEPTDAWRNTPEKKPSQHQLSRLREISADRIRFISTPEQPVCNEPVLAELVDGGLIIFERAEHTSDHNNAKKYLESVYDRIDIEAIHNSDSFVGISTGSEETTAVNGVVCLSWNMKELVEYLGNLVNFNPTQILLWRLSQFNDRPTQSITDSQGKFMKVRDLLGLSGPHVHDPRRHKRYKVIYTKMPIRVDEMERRKQIKVQVMDDKMKVTEMTMFPEKSGTVASLLQEAVKEFKFPPNGSGKLRLVYVGTTLNQMRVFNVFPENAPILEISQKALSPSIYAVRIEEIPVDQADLKSGEMLIPVSHFDKDPQRMFGTPFFVKVVQDEPLCNIKERIQKMLDVPDKEYEKYRFALMSNNRVVRYLEMDSTHRVNLNDLGYNTSQGFQTSAVPPLASSPYLAIEHINKLRGARGGHTAEKSIVIKN